MLNHKGTVIIETERLLLRKLTTLDTDDMYNNFACDNEVAQYMSWSAYNNKEDVNKWLIEWQDEYKKKNSYYWGIVFKKINQVIGTVYLYTEDELALVGSLSYCIGKNWWNQGIMTEAVKHVINFGFSEINYNRIESYHAVSNTASGEIMKKLGMRYEGILRQRCLTHNGFEDCLFYSILKSETTEQI